MATWGGVAKKAAEFGTSNLLAVGYTIAWRRKSVLGWNMHWRPVCRGIPKEYAAPLSWVNQRLFAAEVRRCER